MPQFAIHTPMTCSDVKKYRESYNLKNYPKPIGVIGKNDNYSYGFDGDKYYVTAGILEYLITKIHLTFDEAKALFDALNWADESPDKAFLLNSSIRESRKMKLKGDNLLMHFIKTLRS